MPGWGQGGGCVLGVGLSHVGGGEVSTGRGKGEHRKLEICSGGSQ